MSLTASFLLGCICTAIVLGIVVMLDVAKRTNGTADQPQQNRPWSRRLEGSSALAPDASTQTVCDAIDACRFKQRSARPGQVIASRGANRWTWGELITVWIQPAPAGSTIVIESCPKVLTTVYDGGRNQRNVDLLASALLASTSKGADPSNGPALPPTP